MDMNSRFWRVLLFALVLLSSSIAISQQEEYELTLDEFKLGQDFEEVKTRGEFFKNSMLLSDGQAIVGEESSAHFIDGRIELIGGTSLKLRSQLLVAGTQTRNQVLACAQEQGWTLDREWESYSDVAGFEYLVSRLRVSDSVTLLVLFLKTNRLPEDPYNVSEIYLRTNDVKGPYGDDRNP